MIEETGTSRHECSEQIPVMEVTSLSGTVRRSRNSGDEDVTISGKRRRFGSEDENVDVKFSENVASTEVSGTSDHHRRRHHHHVDSVFMCSVNDDSISDLKAESVSETDNFSRDSSASSVVCLESEEMESLSTVTVNKKTTTTTTTTTTTATATTIEATSRRKQPQPTVTMPTAAELEEFFSEAEKYEQKRFAEKYNFDIKKDVPMEGRYQWVPYFR